MQLDSKNVSSTNTAINDIRTKQSTNGESLKQVVNTRKIVKLLEFNTFSLHYTLHKLNYYTYIEIKSYIQRKWSSYFISFSTHRYLQFKNGPMETGGRKIEYTLFSPIGFLLHKRNHLPKPIGVGS